MLRASAAFPPLLLACLLAASAQAEPASPPPTGVPAADSSAGTPPRALEWPSVLEGRRPNAMVAEMLEAAARPRETLARLRAELRATRDARRSHELRRAIAATKLEAELRMLQVQSAHAKREGRLEAAARLDESIATLNRLSSGQAPERLPAGVPAGGR